MGQYADTDNPWAAMTWDGARAEQERAWAGLSAEDQHASLQQMKVDTVAVWRSHGHDISHILVAPDPASDAAKRLGCICPSPRPGELHMLPNCPVHHYPLGFVADRGR